ncbi:DUF2914 domain-containing protein [Lebetimonas sp. JH369]|uniref:DUF2914 domain-containing protein n=1 Tax=Lebetimonas sp. JH369 TaxID=990069 RepID=UPI000465C449|nr:DUF2914 domain-containing protein [Lebetimonas sp. JH369]
MKKIAFMFLAVFAFSYNLKQFTTCKNVKNLTPVEITNVFTTKDKKVFAFAKFTNIEENRLIDFVWEKNVNDIWKLYADIQLPIYKGLRWRTYSNIKIRPFFTGHWRVSIYDGNNLIAIKEFKIVNEVNETNSAQQH